MTEKYAIIFIATFNSKKLIKYITSSAWPAYTANLHIGRLNFQVINKYKLKL